ncbi:non-ribosomal peptide synthase/polyketide synthase [Pyxidicoccus parkwayensis]|uniref:Non-ribosomal peptide synthase/polyketide synthase n=1 Tax=Pyxidicoccus parkwayensis TaxID=2813578 RepID=A0ABX7P789_9BACT|nr:non-ribosomal peptide synthetase [Pyxidicoccus parkwaysis]QSQ26379.1 non-ribosomal peptide synthase/polyketide synthase [Pyxidicoccus parkwaysis]
MQGDALEQQLSWWRQELAGAPRALELPTDRPRPAAQSFRGAQLPLQLPKALSERLHAFCQHEGVTPFMALLSTWQLLLSRYSGQDDVCVGSPIAGRRFAELEALIGFFVNTLVFRARLDPRSTVRQLLAQVRRNTLGAFEHQDVPFEKLVEELQPERDLSRSPLFQVSFTLQNAPLSELHVPGMTFHPVELRSEVSRFDLAFILSDSPNGFRGLLEYNTDLFDASTVQRMMDGFVLLLDAVVASPDARLGELPLLSEAERQQVLVDWNQTDSAFPRDACVHHLFSHQASLTPDSIAVEAASGHLSYRQLDERSNQLASYLRTLGVTPGTRVGLCLERSLELPIGLLGILKAGAAFVPLDPAYPAERLDFMLAQTGVSVLVTQQKLADELPSYVPLLVCLDSEWDLVSSQPMSSVDCFATADSLAYVMFTSGSTGQPKGVCIPHRGITRLVRGSTFIHFGPDEVFLQLAPISFDASTLEVWGALLHGARLVLFPPHQPTLEELGAALVRHRITTLWLTAALFEQMTLHQPQALASVRQLLAGGDALPAQRVREHLTRLAPGAVLINGYGPTENTTFTCCHRLQPGDVFASSVPIGRPISNTRVFVLDSSLQPVPVGVPGELYAAGDGLAWGYMGRADLTAERFIPSPFGTGERLYRTGDQVRWLPDGTLEFLGRNDSQVKVRGFRIELGEVEAALRAHPEVREAVAVVREDAPGDKRLVAYFVPRQDVDAASLRAFLQQRLPEYMLPSAFVSLQALPLSANGKVDRKTLPTPDTTRSEASEYIAPRTETEVRLASIFSEVLGVKQVGLHDDFFELGGHSLLATQLISRVRQAFQLELSLRELFEAPTLAAFAERLQAASRSQATPITRVSREQPLPLSFAQQRLWFLDQFQPGSTVYSLPLALRLGGGLDVAALQRTFEELVHRHEALRTTFRSEGVQAYQCIAEPQRFPLEVVDLSALPAEQHQAEAQRLTQLEAERPFDLAAGPLLRVALFQLTPTEHVLVLNMHHIVSDGWSIGVLVREVVALYEAFSQGRPSPLPELSLQYADYAAWQRGWLKNEVLEAQLEYWREQLKDAPRALELPTDRPRPAAQSFRGAQLPLQLPKALSERLHAFCQHEGVTPFMALLSTWQLLLSRYSGQDDVCVGSPIAGRRFAELEALIGFFVNTLVFRARLDPRSTVRQLLAQVRRNTLGAFEHQDVPFEKLVEELQPERDLSRSPLFQVSFTLQNAPLSELHVPGMTFHPMEFRSEVSRFDLAFILSDSPNGFRGLLEYNTDLFDASTVQRMMDGFVLLLDAVVASPDARLGELPLLSEAERQQVLVGWNQTGSAFPRDACVHHLFSHQAALTPDSIAVEAASGHLTYRQLDERSNQLASYLRTLGVTPGTRVGLCLERGLELPIGLLGILKAGAAFVPLDPAYPAERLDFMLAQTGVSVLVTQQKLADELPSYVPLLVCLDSEWDLVSSQPTASVDCFATADSLAYVMFTSGSTGQPKGVCIPHRGITRLVRGSTSIHFGPDEVFLQLAPISFDASTLEVWGALLHGARLVFFPPHQPSLEELGAALLRHRVTTLWLTAALFEQMALHQPQALASVRQLLAGGDALPAQRVRDHLERLNPASVLINGYGPTENTTFTACYRMHAGASFGASVPIGRPISNTRVFVLDALLRPVPVGVPGELYAAGDGLAWGYFGRPDLTAERFIPSPFGTGERLYRTGDVARWLPDGTLEFLGRNDSQVKVRGFRIELGEVEAALLAHPAVAQGTAVVREDVPGDKRLVAYFVPRQDVDAASLRAFLQQRLPEYMLPSAFVPLQALPLSANGKVDRKALPAPDTTHSEASKYVAPRTETEVHLASIFSEVLGVKQVGLHDDFFELGGHSLLATQLISRVRQAFQLELSLRELFEAPTVEQFALRLGSRRGTEVATFQAPPLKRASRERALPLSFAQQRLWFLEQLESGSTFYNVPMAIKLLGSLDEDALERSFQELVIRHESLRTVFRTDDDGTPVQVILPAPRVLLQRVDLSGLPAAEREAAAKRWVGQEGLWIFNLSAGPLIKTSLLKLAAEEHVLVLVMHHIVSDGWSLGVLVREMASFYEAFSQGKPSPLPELPVQYADYAAWQRDWLKGEVLEAQLDYWRNQLRDAPRTLELPTDKPRPAVQSFRGARLEFLWPHELWEAIKALAQREGATPFMVLLAAFQTVLARHAGQEDVSVGTAIANRTHAETEGLIGFFVNTLVLRARLHGNPTFRELLAQVREATLGAYAHQEVPFEKLVEELKPERDLSRSPLFQVMFVLQNTPASSVALTGLRMEVAEAGEGTTSKFDLTLGMSESALGLAGGLEFNVDLFEPATMERLLGHLRMLMEGAVAHPEQPVFSLPLLSEAERNQLLVQFNDTAADYPRQMCLHELFERQADLHPDAIAVVDGPRQLTYAQLEAQANRLAHRLRALGVGPEAVVGLYLERSAELVISLLATLKAGGAYLPLDTAYPAEHLAFMLQDSRVRVLLTRPALADSLPSQGEARLLLQPDLLRDEPSHRPAPLACASNLAYVLYTSGSTGRPKGVCIPHRGVLNYLSWCLDAYRVRDGGGSPVHSSFSFDLTVTSLLAPLAAGRGAVLVPEEGAVHGLGEMLLNGSDYSLVKLTPSHLKLLTHQLPPPQLAGRTHAFVIGGEALFAEELEVWRQHAPATRLINEYGPTETVVGCCTYEVTAADARVGPVLIGRPIANTQLYVLDAHGQPVPLGVPGELYIGGEGVGRGYLGRPELTAERFIPHPFSSTPGERLYRTGDLVRWRAHGQLEYLGRLDSQVKVHGFRIELGEIESVLATHPAIREVVALAREDVAGDKRLVGYVTPRQGATLEAAQLREYAKGRLPEYMVPSAFVVLEALPLTPNGKVDRKALPAPDFTATRREGFVAPRTGAEEMLARLFADVLGLKQVGVHDSFFELGGHSLLATQLVSRVRQAFGRELPLASVFRSPSVAQLAQQLQTASHTQAPPITRASREQPLPLSFSQQRLWFLDQLEPGANVYNVPMVLRLEGALDVSALQRSFEELVRRHEALRTTFHTEGGQPLQVISEPHRLPLAVVDLSALSAEQRDAEARRLVDLEVQRPFSLTTGPLLRVALFQLSPTEHVLVLNMHHIVSDGWSMGVLVREVVALYEAFSQGKSSPLPALALQYADYAAWQRGWLQGEALRQQLGWWKQALQGAPAVLELPTDKPRPAVVSHQGAWHPVHLSRELSQALLALCRREAVTPFMALLAGWQLLLSRYSGQHDILVGSPIAGRTHADFEGLIGFFVNTLVLRTRLDGHASFRQLLAQVRSSTLAAYEHQHVPFEKLVEELQPQRSLSHSPLFQVMLTLQNTSRASSSLESSAVGTSALRVTPRDAGIQTVKFDLELGLTESLEGFSGALGYRTDLFEPSTAARMVRHLLTLLEAVVAQPEQPVSALPLLAGDERRAVLVEWNATGTPRGEEGGLHSLFEQQAALTPDAIALVAGASHLTYRELDARANGLAHRLLSLGVGPEVRVGVCAERSAELLVTLLAILKAGAAYVPLDPAYPRQRLAFMLEDARPRVLVGQRPLLDLLPACDAARLELDSAETWASPRTAPRSPVGPNHLAYVLFTSGSTGRPKGVCIEHGSAVAFLRWALATFSPAELAAVLASTSINFDLSVFELFAPLACGGSVILAPNALQLPSLPAADRVTLINTVPSAMAELARAGAIPASVRTVNLAGEPLPGALVQAIHQAAPDLERVYNLYGPTEDTTYSTWALAPRDGREPDIGRPLTGTRAYVLDTHLQPVPVGVPGELYLGGAGLARGYLGQPELTAERFVPDAFSGQPGARLYRTGDKVRWLEGGTLQYLGRIDFQVKVRGFRIELGEVETAVRHHPAIREAVVVAREDGTGGKRLVAYVVPHEDAALEAAHLRAHTQGLIPEYMVPSAFVVLEALPLTPNGKVDRKALPAPDFTATRREGFIAPRTGTEEVLAGLFSEVLGLERAGVHDNFFELGGHSLLATQLMFRVRQAFGVKLPLAVLFQSPTVAQLAQHLEQTRTPAPWSPLVPFNATGAERPFFCVHPVGGNVLAYAHLARLLGPQQPFYGLQSWGLDGKHPPLRSVEEMAASYIQAMRSVQPSGPYLLGGWSMGGVIAYEMARQLEQCGEEVALLALIDSYTPQVLPALAPAQVVTLFIADLLGMSAEKTDLELQALQGLSPEAQLERLREAGERSGVLPPGTDLAQLRALLTVFESNLRALHQYAPQPGGTRGLLLQADQSLDMPEDGGWTALLRGGLERHVLPGNHHSILMPSNVQQLAERLQGAITRRRRSSG